MRLSKCVEKNIFLWCNCICEVAFHLAGTRFEVHAWPCVSLWLQGPEHHEEQRELLPCLCGENERCRHLQKNKKHKYVVKMCVLAYQKHCGAASCFATWLVVSAPDDGCRGVSKSLWGGGDWRSVQKPPKKTCTHPLCMWLHLWSKQPKC